MASFTPNLIWTLATNNTTVLSSNAAGWALDQLVPPMLTEIPALQGFFATYGIITFNDYVFGSNYIFIQSGASAMRVVPIDRRFDGRLKVGQWVDIAGPLQPGKILPAIIPATVNQHGRYAMPDPVDPFLGSDLENYIGRWSELEGVVHNVNSNGTLNLFGKFGTASLWIGDAMSNYLAGCVDARLRVRGVLTTNLLGGTGLLVPSRTYVEVLDAVAPAPFEVAPHAISEVIARRVDPARGHRMRVAGEVTWRDERSFFVQDSSAAIRVRYTGKVPVQIGKGVEVLGFASQYGPNRWFADALVRPANLAANLQPKELDMSKSLTTNLSGRLVFAKATLLSCKENGTDRIFELQQGQYAFIASLPLGAGFVPDIIPGSSVRLTGVCNEQPTGLRLNLLLRSPSDVAVLSGPPWWTWRKTVILVGTLLAVAFGALLWVYLLRRSLERQRSAQLLFSRQVLERVEEDRRRIAANLHDSLGQILLAVKNHALLAMQSNPEEPKLRDRLKEISTTTSSAIDEVRQITHDLRPYQLDRLGLTQAIRALVGSASENGSILFATRVEDVDGLFDKEAEIHVYRIVQEALNNIIKHSHATEAAVVIRKRASLATLSIRDNGRGFDPAKLSGNARDLGYGLNGMAERVRILGGSIAIDSEPGHGVALSIEVPLRIE